MQQSCNCEDLNFTIMKLKGLIAVLIVLIDVTYSSDTIEYEERIETVDTNNGDDDRSMESLSGESYVSDSPLKYYWVPLTKKYRKKNPVTVATSAEVSPKALEEYKKNHSHYFDTPPIHEFKFAVSIQRKGAHYATGALIDSRWVLTSAKEFFNVRESIKLFRMRVGTTDCKHGGVLTPIKEILIYPAYKYGDISNDVALLRLATPAVESEDIEPIRLAQYKACNKFVSTYWPRVFVNNIPIAATSPERVKYNHLRVSTQSLVPWKECFKWMHKRNFTLHESSLCLKPIVVRHSKCNPDAGAPILSSDGLWGVTSGWKSPFCHIDPSPIIVTKTSAPHIDNWLKKWTASPIWNPGATDIL